MEDRKKAENEKKSLCEDIDKLAFERKILEEKAEFLKEELNFVKEAKDEVI